MGDNIDIVTYRAGTVRSLYLHRHDVELQTDVMGLTK